MTRVLPVAAALLVAGLSLASDVAPAHAVWKWPRHGSIPALRVDGSIDPSETHGGGPAGSEKIWCHDWPTLCQSLHVGLGPAGREITGDPDIDRGMAICEAHKHLANYQTCLDGGIVTGPIQCSTPYDYPPDYAKSCAAVEAAWQASDTARRQREAAAKAADDLAWLKQRWGR